MPARLAHRPHMTTERAFDIHPATRGTLGLYTPRVAHPLGAPGTHPRPRVSASPGWETTRLPQRLPTSTRPRPYCELVPLDGRPSALTRTSPRSTLPTLPSWPPTLPCDHRALHRPGVPSVPVGLSSVPPDRSNRFKLAASPSPARLDGKPMTLARTCATRTLRPWCPRARPRASGNSPRFAP